MGVSDPRGIVRRLLCPAPGKEAQQTRQKYGDGKADVYLPAQLRLCLRFLDAA
ncbi:MAG: hypothetical protein WBQ43_03555 [Terriglobales bacterium]